MNSSYAEMLSKIARGDVIMGRGAIRALIEKVAEGECRSCESTPAAVSRLLQSNQLVRDAWQRATGEQIADTSSAEKHLGASIIEKAKNGDSFIVDRRARRQPRAVRRNAHRIRPIAAPAENTVTMKGFHAMQKGARVGPAAEAVAAAVAKLCDRDSNLSAAGAFAKIGEDPVFSDIWAAYKASDIIPAAEAPVAKRAPGPATIAYEAAVKRLRDGDASLSEAGAKIRIAEDPEMAPLWKSYRAEADATSPVLKSLGLAPATYGPASAGLERQVMALVAQNPSLSESTARLIVYSDNANSALVSAARQEIAQA